MEENEWTVSVLLIFYAALVRCAVLLNERIRYFLLVPWNIFLYCNLIFDVMLSSYITPIEASFSLQKERATDNALCVGCSATPIIKHHHHHHRRAILYIRDG